MLVHGRRIPVISIAWFLFGLVLAYAITGLSLSEEGSIYNFYNVGDVYEINDIVYSRHDRQENGHQENSGEVILDRGAYNFEIGIEKNDNKWKLFCCELKNVHSAYLQGILIFLRLEDGIIAESEEIECRFEEGLNLIKVPKLSFNYIHIDVYGQSGDSFYVEDMQLREKAPVFTWMGALRIYLITLAIYCLTTCIFLLIWRKFHLQCQLYRGVEVLQEFYLSVAARLYKPIAKNFLLRRGREWLRTFLFTLMFLYNALVDVQGTYDTRFKYHALVYALIILLLAVLSIEPKLKKKNWNNALAWSWLALWGMACISDFLVDKKYRFLGYAMILVVGFFFFVWNNMENHQEIITDFVRAIHIFLVFVLAFCILFRPEVEGMRYSGTSTNPSVFAMYLGVIWAVILGGVEQGLRECRPVHKILPYIAEGCVVASFCWKAQAVGPILYMLIVAFAWFLKVICDAKRTKTQRKVVLAVLSFFLLLIPVYMATIWGINHIPQTIGKPIAFERDHLEVCREMAPVVYAEENSDAADTATAVVAVDSADTGSSGSLFESRLEQKLKSFSISRILSSRDYYYRAYLRNMNLFGHEKNPKVWGKRRLPHNALLGIAYRYGVFAVVPYILMIGALLVRTFRYGRKNVKYAGMPFWICLISVLMSLTDNVELPFSWLPWIALYLMMGIVFADDE